MSNFICTDCHEIKPIQPAGGTGYGVYGGKAKVCDACCAKRDREEMHCFGRAVFYLVKTASGYDITNWPGTLRFTVRNRKVGRHNIAGSRLDVWFRDSDNQNWHGVQYGDSQLCHCKRVA